MQMSEAEIQLRHGPEFQRCVRELDVDGIIKLWNHVAPAPTHVMSRKEALYSLHMARAQAESIPLHLRQYSDRWLRERGFGAFLPKHLSELKRIRETAHVRG
jgi:hypothetical protein